ncbi:hypothetical protein H0H92_015002 [Tricholoma furcatifolium]|nr:hypothetical protein H0H92_015002 [Tricholoma furcatifolium]
MLRVAQNVFSRRSPRCVQQIQPRRNFSSSRPTPLIFYYRFGDKGNKQNHQWPDARYHPYLAGAGVLAIGYYVSHLEQVPETGRWRFMNTSPATEEEFSQAAREEILQEFQHKILPPNHIVTRHVKRVVTQVLESSNLGHLRGENFATVPQHLQSSFGDEPNWDPDFQNPGQYESSSRDGRERKWEVIVVHEPKIANAMAVPGIVVVFTGILPICKDERGLAAVLSHGTYPPFLQMRTLTHTHISSQKSATSYSPIPVARHIAERISSATVIWAFFGLLQLLFAVDPGITYWVTQLLIEYPNSRTQELEADKIGMNLMARACFDPKGAVECVLLYIFQETSSADMPIHPRHRMFQRMRKVESESSVLTSFFNTHPSSMKRIEELEKFLPEAYDVLSGNPDCAALQDRLQSFRQVTLTGIRDMQNIDTIARPT